MEELPFIPSDLQSEWFDIEALMVQRAIEAGERVLAHSRSSLALKLNYNKKTVSDFPIATRLYRIWKLHRLSQLAEEEPASLNYNLVLKLKRSYVYDSL